MKKEEKNLRIGYRWIFSRGLISRIWQKVAKIAKICLVNNFSPEGILFFQRKGLTDI